MKRTHICYLTRTTAVTFRCTPRSTSVFKFFLRGTSSVTKLLHFWVTRRQPYLLDYKPPLTCFFHHFMRHTINVGLNFFTEVLSDALPSLCTLYRPNSLSPSLGLCGKIGQPIQVRYTSIVSVRAQGQHTRIMKQKKCEHLLRYRANYDNSRRLYPTNYTTLQ